MKIIHTSDLHLSSPIDSHLSPAKARQRRAEIVDSLFRLAEAARSMGARAIIIAGDLFDSERPAGRARDAFLDTVRLYSEIDFLYLSGNHEKSTLFEAGDDLPENLKIFGNAWTYFDYGEVRITGRRGCGLGIFDGLSLDRAKVNIAVLHGAVNGEGEKISLKEAAGKGIDYLALGHFHSYLQKEIDGRGIAVYSGTPEGRGFDECGEKGYVLIDSTGGRVTHKFIPHAKRRIRIVDADLGGIRARKDIHAAIGAALAGTSANDIVRLRLTGEVDRSLRPDSDELKERYVNSYFHFEVEDHTRDVFSSSDYRADKSLKGEFVRLVDAALDISDEDKELIRRAGLLALLGEEEHEP